MSKTFLPGAGRDFLLPFYDPLWRLMGGETMRATFIRDAGLAAGQRILDIGCGTGSLLVQIADTVSGTRLSGLDPDPKALARSRNKAARAGADVNWTEGFADQLPHADASFDRVISSFMFHHLGLDVKRGMLREARRVLVAGGELHLVDFGGKHSEQDGLLARIFHAHGDHAEDLGGGVSVLFEESGFEDVRDMSQDKSLFGRYTHVRGVAH
ncbi:MAG: class I SAM-dependent methyltransferase [Myxococcota bacterium]